jgi:hypothetical protein
MDNDKALRPARLSNGREKKAREADGAFLDRDLGHDAHQIHRKMRPGSLLFCLDELLRIE